MKTRNKTKPTKSKGDKQEKLVDVGSKVGGVASTGNNLLSEETKLLCSSTASMRKNKSKTSLPKKSKAELDSAVRVKQLDVLGETLQVAIREITRATAALGMCALVFVALMVFAKYWPTQGELLSRGLSAIVGIAFAYFGWQTGKPAVGSVSKPGGKEAG